MEEEGYCSDCKRVSEVAYDHATGDAVCMECGLVLESRIADETAEWRTFSNDHGQDRAPIRVGAASDPFLEGHIMETTLVNVGKERQSDQLQRVARVAAGRNSYSSLVQAFGRIDDLCERLSVIKTVKNLACDIYAKFHKLKTETRRDDAVVAACVLIASQKENQSRTLREMRMATGGIAEKKIVSAKNTIMKVLNEKARSMELGTEQASDYLTRFAHNLGLNNRAVRAAQEIFKKTEEHDIRRTPKSIAAGIVYVTCQLCGHKTSARDISSIANTSEGTIKKSYKDLYPYLPLIVPSWFAQEADIKKLHAP